MHAAWAKPPDPSGQISIRILTISNGSTRDIEVPGWADLYGVDWAADSRSVWVAARNSASSTAYLGMPHSNAGQIDLGALDSHAPKPAVEEFGTDAFCSGNRSSRTIVSSDLWMRIRLL